MGHPVRLLQRHLSTAQTLQPGQYTAETGRPSIACPECGGISDVDQTPLADGSVPLLWQCPFACVYAAYLRLEDWGEAVLR